MDSAQINAIAIDDEPAALRIMENFAAKTGHLNLLQTFTDPVEAISFLHSNPVQLIFLDINMPVLSGLELIKSLSQPPLTILTTAYSSYALESYEYDIIDYLLKPIALSRFLKAVNKAADRLLSSENSTSPENHTILIKDSGTLYQIDAKDICCLKSLGNYVKIYTMNQTLVIKSGLQEFLEEYKIRELCRIHKSFAVNTNMVSKMTYSSVFACEMELPIGRKYRAKLRKTLSSL